MTGSRTTCRSCGAPIIFAVTAKGRRMPLDLVRVPEGNIEVDIGDAGSLLASVVPSGSAPTLYKSHFATCPNAKKHRRR